MNAKGEVFEEWKPLKHSPAARRAAFIKLVARGGLQFSDWPKEAAVLRGPTCVVYFSIRSSSRILAVVVFGFAFLVLQEHFTSQTSLSSLGRTPLKP